MRSNLRHPSIRLKHVGEFWSARVGLHWRAVGTDVENGISWFWIGSHAEYDKLIG
ncbi:ParE family toxin-like protein [Povalibacter sp.]|uniref:ParE family toxin-like protein n=1 Tax=Povalibacter sp. TaxID=1962978 RepID=UPI003FA6D1C0